MRTITGAKWQPFGDQFQAACKVCFYRDTMCAKCCDCKNEREPGFVFDPDKYIEMYRELTKKRYWISDDLRPVCIDTRLESEELQAAKKDRDFWRGIADKAFQEVVNMANKLFDSKIKR